MSGCGRLFKGTHKNDDAIPCGTKLTFGVGREPQVTKVWLCDKCDVHAMWARTVQIPEREKAKS